MSQDYPTLALDDLLHIMSPSPAPQTLPDDSPHASSASPEPLPDADIAHMRRIVVEMRQLDKTHSQLTARERELAGMVIKLTAAVRPDPDQLLRQAEMISTLMRQRDLLLHQFDEQRLRWNSEKDGWARMAEALLAQQGKSRLGLERDEDAERLQTAETDNKGLRQRLNETQSRLQMLEYELTRLRPLLLMQPLTSRTTLNPPTPNSKTRHARRRKKDAAATEDEDHGPSEDEPPLDPFDTPHTSYSQTTPKAKSRKSEAANNVHPVTNPHKRRPSHKAASRGLSADARVEHLLLAARKIGKHRAGIMSGMVQHLEERERERRREESATTAVANTPKTPKRNTAHSGYPPEAGYVYLNNQMRPTPGMQPVPMFIPAYSHHLLQTPSSSTSAPSATSSAQQSSQKAKQDARTNNPPTPLDSLLSAARTMMREDIDAEVDEDEEIDVVGDSSPVNSTGTRHARPEDMLGSPVPKRRKVVNDLTSRTTDKASTSTTSAGGPTNMTAGRVRSALDVLADQAAAFSTQEQPTATSRTHTETRTKGKEKEKVDLQRDPSTSATKSRGRTKSRKEELGMDTPSSAASRSRTPRSEMGDDPADTTHTASLAGGSTSEAQVDPGGGTSSSSTSQSLDSTSVPDGNQANDSAQAPRAPDAPPHVDEDATPRQGSYIQDALGKGSDSTRAVAQPNFTQLPVSSRPQNECRRATSEQLHVETIPLGSVNSGCTSSGRTTTIAPAKNKELARVAEQDVVAPTPPAKRQRSPYVKWSKEEDDLLAQAVAKYGQKWDLVQKALPSRGYHQVRQRWLRKLGVFDTKPDLSSYQTAATTFPSTSRGEGVEPRGNPKLGLAPLSSEKAFSGLVGRPPSLPSS